LKNIDEFMKINNSINKNINDIISDNNIAVKLKNLICLYYKFNSQIKQEGSIKNNDKENINEIKEEKNGTKKYTFDYNKYKLDSDGNKEYPAIVIDNGSTFLRFGISGDNVPRGEIPTCIGYPTLEKKKKYWQRLFNWKRCRRFKRIFKFEISNTKRNSSRY